MKLNLTFQISLALWGSSYFVLGYESCNISGVSQICCSGNEELHSKNDFALLIALADCTSEGADSCNTYFDECIIDYHDYQCDDDYKDLCERLGGKVIEGDYVLTCSSYGESFSLVSLNTIDCVAPSCSEKEFTAFSKAGAADLSDLYGMDCTFRLYSETGDPLTPTLAPSTPSLVDPSHDGGPDAWVITLVLLICVVIIAAVIFVVFSRMKNRAKPAENATVAYARGEV